MLGRELTGVYPVGFLARRHALAVAIVSYNGKIGFGLLADRDAVPDLELFAELHRRRGARSFATPPG